MLEEQPSCQACVHSERPLRFFREKMNAKEALCSSHRSGWYTMVMTRSVYARKQLESLGGLEMILIDDLQSRQGLFLGFIEKSD